MHHALIIRQIVKVGRRLRMNRGIDSTKSGIANRPCGKAFVPVGIVRGSDLEVCLRELARFFTKCFPNTSLPTKQFLEIDKHQFFVCTASAEYNFKVTPFKEGVEQMFSSSQ